MEPIRCYCGNPISQIYDAFVLMKKIHAEQNPNKGSHINFNMYDPDDNLHNSKIFEALGLDEKKYCCKKTLNCSVQFHDLEVQDRL